MGVRIVVITGTSKGLGLVLAREFSSHDWQVIGTGRSERPAELPEAVGYERFDASDAAACEAFWLRLQTEHADAEVCLINNAGGYVGGSLLETQPADYAAQMQSIYFAAVYMTRGLAATFARARIVNIISDGALHVHKNNTAYGAAKAAEMHFFQALQHELAADHYRITNLYPSDIATREPNPAAIQPADLARLVREQAELQTSYYLRDAVLYPAPN